jgi:hypothetical protein
MAAEQYNTLENRKAYITARVGCETPHQQHTARLSKLQSQPSQPNNRASDKTKHNGGPLGGCRPPLMRQAVQPVQLRHAAPPMRGSIGI